MVCLGYCEVQRRCSWTSDRTAKGWPERPEWEDGKERSSDARVSQVGSWVGPVTSAAPRRPAASVVSVAAASKALPHSGFMFPL